MNIPIDEATYIKLAEELAKLDSFTGYGGKLNKEQQKRADEIVKIFVDLELMDTDGTVKFFVPKSIETLKEKITKIFEDV